MGSVARGLGSDPAATSRGDRPVGLGWVSPADEPASFRIDREVAAEALVSPPVLTPSSAAASAADGASFGSAHPVEGATTASPTPRESARAPTLPMKTVAATVFSSASDNAF